MFVKNNRREFLCTSALAGVAACTVPVWADRKADPPFKISLAEWSLHRTIFDGKLERIRD